MHSQSALIYMIRRLYNPGVASLMKVKRLTDNL